MAFAAIYIPNFTIQAVVFTEPQLHSRAIALLDGKSPLFSVIAMNEGAKQAGIQIGMAESQAEQFYSVEKRYRSKSHEQAVHSALLDLCWAVSPRIEDTAPDTLVIDLTGMRAYLGSPRNIAEQLARRADAFGLKINIAISERIEVAIHAARGFAGITVVPAGKESEILAVLPVHVLFPSIESRKTLERWGVRTCGDLSALPVKQLSERLGQEGVRLQALARGETIRLLVLSEPTVTFTEELELDYAVEDLEPLSFLLGRLLHKLCARLQNCSLALSAIRLRCDLGDPFEKDSPIFGRQSNSEITPKLYEKLLRLPLPVRDSQLLLNLLRLQLQNDPPQASIMKISITAEPALKCTAQKQLFQPNSVDPEKLELTIARLSNFVGASNVGAARTLDTDRPDAFHMNHFLSANESLRAHRNSNAHAEQFIKTKFDEGHPQIALRMFRPEWQARIIMPEKSPAQIFFRGLRGTISTASGPWRSSGDWWRENTWDFEEWDVFILFDSGAHNSADTPHANAPNGLYRIYYDHARQKWYVRGRYD